MSGRSFLLGGDIRCDLARLVDTRLLVQANSGGGKSWCLRRLLEQTHGKVQHLVVDPEGEFSTLRERFDYILAARQGGDTMADPRSAKLLAERLLELGVSAVIDIYELKAHERVAFVQHFLEALIDAPKKLWHPALVIVDEAHVYCPQKGDAASASAVIDLCTRGRKRGFCAVLATQRLSKLHKDAAAELNNKLIGRTGLDLDMKRAADELGLAGREQIVQLRQLPDGHFFAFGPAISLDVKTVHIGLVQTTHPKAGARLAHVAPPPTDKVRALLPKLADLPAEAQERQKSLDDLKRDNAQLRRELTLAQRTQKAADPAGSKETRDRLKHLDARLARLGSALEQAMKFIVEINAQDFFKAGGEAVDGPRIQQAIEAAVQQTRKLIEQSVTSRQQAFEKWRREGTRILRQLQQLIGDDKVQVTVNVRHNEAFTVTPGPRPIGNYGTKPAGDGKLAGSRQRILDVLAWLETIGLTPAHKTQVAIFAGQSPTSGGYFNNLGALRTVALIEYPQPSMVSLTDAGRAAASPPEVVATTEELHRQLETQLPRSQWLIVKACIDVYPADAAKDEVAERVGQSPTSGGYFNNLGRLRSLGLIEYPQPGRVIARSVLFLDEARR